MKKYISPQIETFTTTLSHALCASNQVKIDGSQEVNDMWTRRRLWQDDEELQ